MWFVLTLILQNLKRSLEELYTGVKFWPVVKEPVHLSDDTVLLVVPNDVAGWSVIPDRMPCEVHNGTLHQYVFINGIRVSGCTLWFMFLLFLALTLQFTRDEVDAPLNVSDYFSACSYPPKIQLGFVPHKDGATQEAQCTLTVRGFVEGLSFPLLLSLPTESHLLSPPMTSPKASLGKLLTIDVSNICHTLDIYAIFESLEAVTMYLTLW